MTKYILTLAILFFSMTSVAFAGTPTITISSNNTPLDRKALSAISEEIFRRVGVEFKLVSLPSERSLVSANQGMVDGEGLRVAGLTGTYPNLIMVPERYIGISFVAFAKDKRITLDRGWESLKPYSVAFINGWKMFGTHTSDARIIHRVEKPEQLFRMLDSGRIDLALYTLADGLALVRDMGFSFIVPLSPSLMDVDMYLYLNKKHESLVPQLTQALRDIKADGTYHKIMATLGNK
jgi:polar amino acid transport system substrate-binding protein